MGFLRAPELRSFSLQIPGGKRNPIGICIAACLLGLLALHPQSQAQVENPLSPPPVPIGKQQKAAPQPVGAASNGVAHPLTDQPPAGVISRAATKNMRVWEGLRIKAVDFQGVDRSRLEPLPEHLPVQPGMALSSESVRQSVRRLYATGLYSTITVQGERQGDEVTLRFQGSPQMFIGRVTVEGLKSDQLSTQLQRATRLTAGTRYDEAKMTRAADLLNGALQTEGYYQATFATTMTQDVTNALVNVVYHVTLGKQTRIGAVKVTGDPGMTVTQFRKKGKLKDNAKVNRDTVSRALSDLQKNYEKKQRLEATVALDSKQYQPPKNLLNYSFQASQGPLVTIRVDGVKLSKGKIRGLIPAYEEGTVDEDLLNEGDRRLRDYYQRQGYFDVKATHTQSSQGQGSAGKTTIVFDVQLGTRRRVTSLKLAGNRYFGTSIILPRLSVEKASLFNPHGLYSQALAEADTDTIEALYQSNGFNNVAVTSVVTVIPKGPQSKVEGLAVEYKIVEGKQDLIGKYEITGTAKVPLTALTPLLSTQSGQPYSLAAIAGDRDSILTYYYSQGFNNATAALTQSPEPGKTNRIDVTLHVTEGNQARVNRVLISGLHYTRPSTVQPHIQLKPGQPLNQSALSETQHQLYDLTLFNEVNTAVENPRGAELRKDVLVQITEAKRWDLSYGVGFQAQTGNPQTNCPNPVSLIQLGINPSQFEANCGTNGKTGASALVLFDVSRINLWGRDQSITLRSEYGSLEQSATTIYSFPHIFNRKTLDFSLSGGYTNAQDVTTYAASRLEGTVRFTEKPNLPNTLIYQFTYRRVKVDPNSVQVAPNDIPLVSEPVRVGGPGITWVRDTRRPTPLDAVAGTYTSAEEFVTDNVFESEANFNRLDLTNSSYYQVGKRHYVLARNTRFGYERSFGQGKYEYIPLPERLYAGGAQSLRAYSINSAGPRDSLTGFPIGGAGVLVNSGEIRFPNPNLPYLGTAMGFVLFHDMGNVFNNSSDIWPSVLRIDQPHSDTCRDKQYLTVAAQEAVSRSSSTNTTGTCDFNYFTHDVGLGMRYHTPIGPVRLDFSYTLNPPVYPVVITYGTNPDGSAIPPHPSHASNFNFFFSIGQAF